MTRLEETRGLRARTDVHFNCCQSVLVPFAGVCGLDKDAAFRLGTSFGAGVRCGSACGALTGALMVLGLAGKDLAAGEELLRRFRAQNGPVDCAGQLWGVTQEGEDRKPHCDGLVYSAVALLEDMLK